ncbi:MAG: ABC transporter permease [Cyclobacteriaceae bacterium]
MHKIGLIISREYLTRVRKKSFIIMTIIGPVLFAALIILPTWLASQDGEQKVIEVLDDSGNFTGKFQDTESLVFEYITGDLDAAKERVPNDNTFGLLYIPAIDIDQPAGISLYTLSNPSIVMVKTIERTITNEVEEIKLTKSGIDKETLASLKADITVDTISLSTTGEEKASSSGAASIAGYVSSFLIYFFIFYYGAQIMRGVIEEKTNRILEVIISSVRPMQLMLGKIIGVAAVGLTQFVLWVMLTFAISSLVAATFGIDASASPQMSAQAQDVPMEEIDNIMSSLTSLNFPLIIGVFLFYFLGGYLMYGALFAAVGSAVDSDADSQQFMFPITIPLIFSIVVLGAVLKDPDGSLAFWMSMIPLTSPVVMMMRTPFGVPEWQLALSMALLIGGFLFTSWVAGRIYRVGILMHGTKVNYKTLAKWFVLKN